MEHYRLDKEFILLTDEEVFATVSFLETRKSPGPDGFIAKFFKFFWSTIKSNILLMIQGLLYL